VPLCFRFSFRHAIAFLVQQMNTVLPLPVLYIVFDLFYTVIHWALHIKAIYGYIHKHHHHQKAPRYSIVRVLVGDVTTFQLHQQLYTYRYLILCLEKFVFCITAEQM
jgi:sterol desaturase/sphingolipid hydroxylase (fatty acid hydroxylase superfamily)